MPLQVVASKIGSVELFQVIELQIGPVLGEVLPRATKEEVQKIDWLKYPYVNGNGTLNGVSQAFIVRTGPRTVVVDTCIGNDKERASFSDWSNLQLDFLETLDLYKIDRLQVTDVLCTHLHMDHVGWNTHRNEGNWIPTFPNARYHFAKEEYEHWRAERSRGTSGGHGESFDDSVVPIVEAGLVNLIDGNADLGDGISVLATPGHSIAHVCAVFQTGAELLIISGDCMHHPCQVARPEWSSETDYDKQQSAETRRVFFSTYADTNTIVAGTHFSIPSLGYIKKVESNQYEFHALKRPDSKRG